MKFKIFIFTATVLILSLALVSCSQKEYSDNITCHSLASTLRQEASVPEGEFAEYGDEEITLLFPNTAYNDICILYSKDATDITELGILHAQNEETAKAVLEDVKNYIKNLQEEKREFLRNYSPAELEKLNAAEARQFGNYVIFTVAQANEKNLIFSKAANTLTKE